MLNHVRFVEYKSFSCHNYKHPKQITLFFNMAAQREFQKRARVSSSFQTQENFETMRLQVEWFYCFRALGNLMKPEARVFKITSTKKITGSLII